MDEWEFKKKKREDLDGCAECLDQSGGVSFEGEKYLFYGILLQLQSEYSRRLIKVCLWERNIRVIKVSRHFAARSSVEEKFVKSCLSTDWSMKTSL